MQSIRAVPGSTDEFSHSHRMQSCFLLSIWVLHERQLGIVSEPFDFGYLNEVIYSLASVFEMKT